MKERPILFTPENAQKVHDGTKTQTRRIMKSQPDDDAVITMGELGSSHGVAYIGNRTSGGIVTRVQSPYGVVGDRLWVREHVFVPPHITYRMWREGADTWPNVMYRAEMDGTDLEFCKENKWESKPSIFMPRWACRTVVEIIEIRVERLKEISGPDCIAEGVRRRSGVNDGVPLEGNIWKRERADFALLWESIHGKGSWERNDWVWAITFKVVR